MQTTIEVGSEIPEVGLGCRGQCPDHEPTAGREHVEARAHQVAQSATDPVAGHRVAHRAGHDEADPARIARSTCRFVDILGHQVQDDQGAGRPASASDRLLEVSCGGQARAGGQHPGAEPQTARLLRPLRRRADRIARPARVRIRSRKPCTLWRRRLFGWYVRLLTSSLQVVDGTVHGPGRTTHDVASLERTTGTACPRARTLGKHCGRGRPAGPVVDMRHRSNRSRPANGTRRASAGSIRRGRHQDRAEPPILTGAGRRFAATRRVIPETCGEPVARPRHGLLASGHRTHPRRGQARPIESPRTLHTLWTKVWIGTSGPTRRNSRGRGLRIDVHR